MDQGIQEWTKQNFLKAVFTKITWSMPEYLDLYILYIIKNRKPVDIKLSTGKEGIEIDKSYGIQSSSAVNPLKSQFHKMVKHIQTISRQFEFV